jgi:N-acetylmuramoyl-L-alanine amidase
MNILGKATATYTQAEAWVKSIKSANKLLLENLPIIWKAAEGNGINPVVMLAQVCCETGYFNFGGVLNASFHNTCGLKTTKGGGDYEANAHMRFKSWEEGIQAHADHLGLYAGAKNCPKYSPNTKNYTNEKYKANGTTLDPRHFTYLYGKCPTVEGLSGTWATDKKYATTLKSIIAKIEATKAPVTETAKPKVDSNKNANGTFKNGVYNRKARVTAGDGLNVRAGRPGSASYSKKLGVLKKDEVIVVKYCLNNWFGVIYKGKQGFICGKYIELL